jgi:hypothetical protein
MLLATVALTIGGGHVPGHGMAVKNLLQRRLPARICDPSATPDLQLPGSD